MLLSLILLALVIVHALGLRYVIPAKVSEEQKRDSTVNRLYGRADAIEHKVVFGAYAIFAALTVWIEKGELADGLHMFLAGVWGLGAIMITGTVVMGLLKGRIYRFAIIGLVWRLAGLYALYANSDIMNNSRTEVLLVLVAWEGLYRAWSSYSRLARWSVNQEKLAAQGVNHGES